MNKQLKQWESATEELVIHFIDKYFPDYNYKEDCFWVADQIGDVMCIADYFFNIDMVLDAFRYGATSNQLFTYYDAMVDAGMEDRTIANFKNYIKHGIL